MAGLLADLSVAGRLLLRATGRRLRGELEPEPDRQAFSDELEPILASAPEGLIRQASWLDLPANQAGSAAMRQHGQSPLCAVSDDLRNLFGRPGMVSWNYFLVIVRR